MLKITTRTETTTTIFELEGKLAGPWVQELETCWQSAANAKHSVLLKLKAVSFIDAAGRKLLADMHRQGAKLVGEGCMTKAVVEEIRKGEGV